VLRNRDGGRDPEPAESDMKALVFLGAGDMAYREEPSPEAGEGEVLVRVDACGICGSDMHGWHGVDPRRRPPLIMGHEAAGWIETGPRRGERVAINPLLSCLTCDACLAGQPQLCPQKGTVSLPPYPGAFAELVRVPERNLVTVPDDMSLTTAALAEPVAVSYHAVELGAHLARRPLSALRVLVIGGGPIGLTAGLVLKARAAKAIIVAETNSLRAEHARRAGLDVVDAKAAEPDPRSIDLVIDAVGATETRSLASRVVRDGGVIVHLGLLPGSEGLDVRRLTLGEIIFTGSFCYTPVDFRETLDLLASGRLGALDWIEERPMSEGPAAFFDLDRGTAAGTKIILRN
jgi:threonine dehydrogenase-like Zn-dependent dehydrogenase